MTEDLHSPNADATLDPNLAWFLLAVAWKFGNVSVDDSEIELHTLKLRYEDFYVNNVSSIEIIRSDEELIIIARK